MSNIELEIKQENSEQKPIFEAGVFRITNISSPAGFNIRTRSSLRRREKTSQSPLNRSQRDILKASMQEELEYVRNITERQAKNEGRLATSADYRDAFKAKIGIRNIEQDGDELIIDIKPVSFPVYSELIGKDTAKEDLLSLGEATGTAAVVFTNDGKLLIQYRSERNNRSYKNIPGASVAGMLDGQFNRRENSERGTLIPIDSEYITQNLKKEIKEELSVNPDEIDTKIIGVAHDEIKPHHEFLIQGTIDKSAEELEANGLILDELEGHDSKERFFAIDGSPQAIETLLTQVRCPLPPTHAAVFFMAGYELVLKKEGESSAQKWAKRVSEGIKKNYKEIDKIVQKKYSEYPAQIGDLQERSRKGYDPKYTPEQQGIPSLLEELLRTGLITQALHDKLKSVYG